MATDTPTGIFAGFNGSALSTVLKDLLMEDSIEPGSDASYQLCKTLYLYHPLGQKMADAPLTMAQSQARTITVQSAPDEVVKAFTDQWDKDNCDGYIHNVYSLSRVYGIASITLGCEGKAADIFLEPAEYWQLPLFFNVLDPLNTAGSLVLNQVPTAADFNKPVAVRTNGATFHRSRYQVVMNETPVYLAYTTAAFGFVGRSVYQRALFPLKSFVRSMIADDMIETKLGLLVAKQEQSGSVLDAVMAKIVGLKRSLLKQAQTGQVLSIGVEEDIETLNMMNVDGAGGFARTNILKNIATAADMPAKLLENETLVQGFGEGTEDAKNIARYVGSVRKKMDPTYRWFDNIVQYRAWNPDFVLRMQSKYPQQYGGRSYFDVFAEWRATFTAEWPSLLIEPESEEVKVEDTKLKAITSVVEVLLPEMDPDNKVRVIEWMANNLGENKRMFAHDLILDYVGLGEHQNEQLENERANEEAQREAARLGLNAGEAEPGEGGEEGAPPGKKGDEKQPPVRKLAAMKLAGKK
jgi:hypothetical protein